MKKKVLSFLFAVVLTAMLLPLNKVYAGNTELPEVANWRALATAMNGGSSTGVADVFTVEDKDNTRTITLLSSVSKISPLFRICPFKSNTMFISLLETNNVTPTSCNSASSPNFP